MLPCTFLESPGSTECWYVFGLLWPPQSLPYIWLKHDVRSSLVAIRNFAQLTMASINGGNQRGGDELPAWLPAGLDSSKSQDKIRIECGRFKLEIEWNWMAFNTCDLERGRSYTTNGPMGALNFDPSVWAATPNPKYENNEKRTHRNPTTVLPSTSAHKCFL